MLYPESKINCRFLSLQMFFQVWPLGSAHEATYLRPGEKGEKERESKREKMTTKSEKSASPKNIQWTLGAHEGVWPQKSPRGICEAAWAKVVGFYTFLETVFSSAISHALPSPCLEVRHCQTPLFLFFPHSLLYSSPQAWDRKWHIMYKTYMHIHSSQMNSSSRSYNLEWLPSLLCKPHHNSQPAALSYTASNQTR